MEYSFDIDVAREYGVDESIMIKNFQFWIMKNKANDKNYNDDRTWTYNSVRAFIKLFPFWNEKQIRRILQSLITKNILITGNYNNNKYDRTLWYAFANEEIFLSILPKEKMEEKKTKKGKSEKVNSIQILNTDNKTNDKPDKETAIDKELYAIVKESFYTVYERLYKEKPVFTNRDFKDMKFIVSKAVLVDKDNPADVLKLKMIALYKECEKNNKFWRYTPGKLLWGWNDLIPEKNSTINTKSDFERIKKENEDLEIKARSRA